MKILIIGGTYFAGRSFTKLLLKRGDEIFLLNRGNVPISSPGIVSIKSDRRDYDNIKTRIGELKENGGIPDHMDAVVDFCGYQKGDIEGLISVLSLSGISFDRYIFVSTCDVLMHGTGEVYDEDGPKEDRLIEGDVGLYVKGKVALEEELVSNGCKYTILRPPFLYGPYNYAPRESIYFKWIQEMGQIVYPVDADGRFQMVYTDDLAEIIYRCIGNPAAENRVFNVCGEEVYDYRSFTDALVKGVGNTFDIADITTDDCISGEVPMPFPLYMSESNIYIGDRIKDIFDEFTPLDKGLKACYDFYVNRNVK